MRRECHDPTATRAQDTRPWRRRARQTGPAALPVPAAGATCPIDYKYISQKLNVKHDLLLCTMP